MLERKKHSIFKKTYNWLYQWYDSFLELKLMSRKQRKEMAQRRITICKQCEFFKAKTSQCEICSCFMKIKTKLPKFECDKGYWLAETAYGGGK